MSMDFKQLVENYNIKPTGIIQVGAHYSQELPTFVCMGFKKIDLIEPCEEAINVSKLEIAKHLTNDIAITLHEVAVGSEEANLTMYVERANQGMSNSFNKPLKHLEQYPNIQFNEQKTYPVRTIDALIQDKINYNCLYIDAQSYELHVLKGAIETLQHIECIFTEINFVDMYENGVIVEDLDLFLSQFDFKRVWTDKDFGGWSNAFYVKI